MSGREVTMPTTTDVVLTGPEGHVQGKRTEWDYDRAGGAYLITCECGWRSSQHWSPKDASDEYDKHVGFVRRLDDAAQLSDSDLAAKLGQLMKNGMGGSFAWGNEWLIEAAKRLAR